MDTVIDTLLASPEPSVRYRTRVHVLGEDPAAPERLALREEIRRSPRVAALLAPHLPGPSPLGPYQKWRGAHWTLVALAELAYPPGDESLAPLREQELDWLLSANHGRVLVLDGRPRRHAAMEANAVFALLRLGLADERVDELAQRLLSWQWPDGGWNCDKRPAASHSSFHESLIPLRALALYIQVRGDTAAREAATRAAEVFLGRRLFRQRSDGAVIDPDFVTLHYPHYWHFDILFGLTVLAEASLIGDPRCADALDVLESKRLPDGGFPAEGKYYRVTTGDGSQVSTCDWGGVSKQRLNEWVTVEALAALRAAGRLS